ncbi:uncharacterized protein DMAD_04791 [Drosophila madeirensis]|uniref:Uncharacterized protein n=1 Tax=Drosophila madeirensis TaxID=30013 RepID=A0AAU9GEV2_DROMD
MFGTVFRAISLLRARDVLATGGLTRTFRDKGRGEEKNHFKRIEMEQLKKIRQDKIKEMQAQIEDLKNEIKAVERGFSEDSKSVKKSLLKQIQQLENSIERIKKSMGGVD